MKEFAGISGSPGIIIGRVFHYIDDAPSIPKYDIQNHQIDDELNRFHKAVDKASAEIQELKERSVDEMGEEESRFLDSHILMLSDPDFKGKVQSNIKDEQKNAEWILLQVIEDLIQKLNSSENEYLRERTLDISDVAKRVMNHLMYREKISLRDLSEEVVLVTHNLLPSDTVGMNKRMVKGIAMDAGGKTSHTAILARSFEIPAVLGLGDISRHVKNGDEIIVDGNKGVVILNPDDDVRARYEEARQKWQQREVQLLYMNDLAAETRDGKLIRLKANIEVPEEIDSVLAHGSDGIGLFRSEFLFLQPGRPASEEFQFKAYKRVLESMEGQSVVIRTLDVGGDKIIPDIENLGEKNPILGWRAVRFCLQRRSFFLQQLRALLRASVYGHLKIMFPMISGVEELDQVLEILEEARKQLRDEEVPFDRDIEIGVMIEVPSAAMTSDILARKVSFFSIGTNDLIQYTIAVDRGNEKVAYLYEPFHPGVLRMIKMVIDNAHDQGIPVSMCGEMAGSPRASVILLGLGLDEFSMSAAMIPEIKKIIRSVSISEAEELVGTIMEMRSFRDIDNYVKEWMEERFDLETV